MALVRWHLVATTFPLTACLQLSTGDGSGTSSTSAQGGSTSTPTGSESGTNCTTDPQSGVVLCERIANCPSVDVAPGAFPGCGFRLHVTSLYDLECQCGDSLCPIGAPANCADAQRLLDQEQSSLFVCQQMSEGTCLPLAAPAASGTTSACDKDCESRCAGDPSCIQGCGC